MFRIISVAVSISLLMAGEAVHAAEPEPMKGPEIIATFEGQSVSGAYADGMAVRETYATDGSISYWDPRGPAKGRWSVTNDLFCTFYDGMEGGCFRVERIGTNCFDYLVAASSTEEALAPKNKPRYVARAAITGKPSTCPDELQV